MSENERCKHILNYEESYCTECGMSTCDIDLEEQIDDIKKILSQLPNLIALQVNPVKEVLRDVMNACKAKGVYLSDSLFKKLDGEKPERYDMFNPYRNKPNAKPPLDDSKIIMNKEDFDRMIHKYRNDYSKLEQKHKNFLKALKRAYNNTMSYYNIGKLIEKWEKEKNEIQET